jgi:hypothetical protein
MDCAQAWHTSFTSMPVAAPGRSCDFYANGAPKVG